MADARARSVRTQTCHRRFPKAPLRLNLTACSPFTLALSRPKSGPQGDGNHLGGLTQARGDHQGGAWAGYARCIGRASPTFAVGASRITCPRQPFEQTMNTILG